jgi:hypothetical protein
MSRRRPIEFRVGGRYGYSAVDAFDKKTGGMIDTVICGITRKEAEIIAGQMAQAYGDSYAKRAKRLAELHESQQKQRMKQVL